MSTATFAASLFLPFHQIQKPEWAPDFGPADYIPSWGATVTGARSFLIAYNVNLLATKEQAHRMALNIREQGRGPSQVGKELTPPPPPPLFLSPPSLPP